MRDAMGQGMSGTLWFGAGQDEYGWTVDVRGPPANREISDGPLRAYPNREGEIVTALPPQRHDPRRDREDGQQDADDEIRPVVIALGHRSRR